ncbi:hypothetical protein vseg_012803 [Gypsophila vaccaria]
MATSGDNSAATTTTSAAKNTASAAVDASLWFNSFSLLLTDLENLSPSSDIPHSLAEKLKENRRWFLNTVDQFKPPCQSSRNALNAGEVVFGGGRKLSVKPQLKDLALKLSSIVLLDEVQSYIIVERSVDHSTPFVDGFVQGVLYEIVLQYYTERQCLLKCSRQIIVHALNDGSAAEEGSIILDVVRKLISDGFEGKLISILNKHFSSTYPQHMDVDFFVLWAEDMLLEGNLVLDILFLAYYESFCTCSAANWKELCLLYKDMTGGTSNFTKLKVSTEACKYYDRAKIQMLLILIETLDLESLLQMIHDEVPFRKGSCVFASSDVVELDSIISNLDIFESKEAGPLILAWAVFLCLIVSLPEKEEINELMEIDHVGYVRQAFESASLSLFLEILQSDVLKDSDGPVAGYRSILRTFMSAFVASYEINSQLEDDTFRLILTILSEIYRGEESLCIQFWDKRSIVDGPIRSLLCNLEGEFPCRTLEFAQFLSALSEGCWPAECVYNYLEKSVGISSMLDISSSLSVGEIPQIVETQLPLRIPGVEGLFIPSRTRGRILRMIDSKTAVVRWEYKQSGVLVLLLRLAQVLELDGSKEVLVILDLFSRLASFNMAVCFSLMNIGKSIPLQANYGDSQMESQICCSIDVVEILCNLVRNLSPYSTSTYAMSMGINILSKMMRCSPSHVSKAVMKMNIFDLSLKASIFSDQNDGLLSSASWFLSGRLAKMLLTDCELHVGCPLTISVLDFTVQLLEAGVENEFAFALIIFCLQYVFVNHEYWKYKVKKDRWNVTQKVLRVLQQSIISSPRLKKIGGNIRDVILSDFSVHSMIFRIVCTTSPALEKLYTSRLYDWRDIDGLQQALCSMLDILSDIFSTSTEDDFSALPIFYQAMISSSTKPIPVVEALASLMSYSRNPAIQLRATESLSMLCSTADRLQPYMSENAQLSLAGKQVIQLKHSIESVIGEQSEKSELFVAVIKLLTSVANHQPVFFAGIFAGKEMRVVNDQTNGSACRNNVSENIMQLVDALLEHVEGADSLIERNAQALLSILEFFKALWEGAAQYSDILESIRKSKRFWKQLSRSVLLMNHEAALVTANLSEADTLKVAYKYQCQAAALDILSLELFLQKKFFYAESLSGYNDKSLKGKVDGVSGTNTVKSAGLRQIDDIFLTASDDSALSNLLKSCAHCPYDANSYRHAKIASGLLTAHLIGKLATGDAGSLSVSLAEVVAALSTKLINLPAFLELCTQYSQRSYSEGSEIRNLILSDLYYHLQGELEGRSIEPGPFNELSQFLIGSNLLQAYEKKGNQYLKGESKVTYLFDISRLQCDTGLDVWDYSEWKASKHIAENTFFQLQQANFMLLLVGSRLPALRALVTFINLNIVKSSGKEGSQSKKDYGVQILSSIEQICKELKSTVGLFAASSDVPQEVFDFVAVQAELLLSLVRYVGESISSPTCLVILKTCVFGLKGLRESRLMATEVKQAIRFLLLMLQLVVGFCSRTITTSSSIDNETEVSGEVSNVCLGLLPLLCSCNENPDQMIISLATIDLIIKRLLTPSSWLPIIKQHLQLQLLIPKLHDKDNLELLPVVLKFFLTLAGVSGGGEMILASGFLSSLRVLIAEISDGGITDWVKPEKSTTLGGGIEKPQFIWELGLAVLVAIICSLGDTTLCSDVVDGTISYFFSEKAHLIAYHLSVPEILSDSHDKKRARAQKRQTSLYALRETEHTLMLICVLAKHRNSWVRAIKEMGSELRQKIIHLLAFISRRSHLFLESSSRAAPFLCVPLSKEEIGYCQKPSSVNSRSAWFSVAALACIPIANVSSESMSTAIVVKDSADRQGEIGKPTYYSDTVAIQLYKIAFLVLKFLCLQADDAVRRAEELGSIDLSHFPELPDPEILHGLQDQAFAIGTEICEAGKSKSIHADAQDVCLLMLKLLEMSLHLEFCVSQICGIRPVMGRVEEFSKQMRLLVRATEGHTFLKSSVKHLKQIVSFMYPGLLQSEGIL